jgi:hypothetical protein
VQGLCGPPSHPWFKRPSVSHYRARSRLYSFRLCCGRPQFCFPRFRQRGINRTLHHTAPSWLVAGGLPTSEDGGIRRHRRGDNLEPLWPSRARLSRRDGACDWPESVAVAATNRVGRPKLNQLDWFRRIAPQAPLLCTCPRRSTYVQRDRSDCRSTRRLGYRAIVELRD